VSSAEVIRVLRTRRFVARSEDRIQEGIAYVLKNEEIPFRREVSLAPRDRIDFMVGRCGVEVKVKGTTPSVQRQLERYAEHDEVEEILLVTTKSAHVSIARELNGKPVHVFILQRGL